MEHGHGFTITNRSGRRNEFTSQSATGALMTSPLLRGGANLATDKSIDTFTKESDVASSSQFDVTRKGSEPGL